MAVCSSGYLWLAFTQMEQLGNIDHKLIVEGKGCIIKDIEGKEYIDGMGGISTTSIGHGRKELIGKMTEQGSKIEFIPLFDGFVSKPAIQLSQKLKDITPGNLSYVQFGCSGSEAVEIAIKIARQYFGNKGFLNRYKVIARKCNWISAI
jgi:adenosylmethionine-8-amino-7-oxononanoate aminotransferase